MEYILSELKRVQRRILLLSIAHNLCNALLLAFVAAGLWLGLSRLFPVLGDPIPVGAGLVLVAILAAMGLAFHRRPTLQDAALACDVRLGLRERVCTSLELGRDTGSLGPRSREMLKAVEADASQKLQSLNVSRDFPLVPSRAMRWLAIPILLYGVAYVLLPEFDLFNSRERAIEASLKSQSVEEQSKALALAAKKLERPEHLPKDENDALAELAKELALVAEKLRSQEITEKQALARVATLSEKVEAQRQALENLMPKVDPSAPGEAKGLGKGAADAMRQGKLGEAAQKMKELQEKLKKGGLSEQEKKELAKDLETMKKMLEKGEGAMNEALAQALAKAAAGLNADNLDAAAQAMGEMSLSLEDMQSLAEQMEKMDQTMAELGEWKESAMGESKYCRNCGKALKPCKKPGNCEGGECGGDHQCAGTCSGGQCSGGAGNKAGSGNGSGMGGEGQGAGNQVGELPEGPVAFKPTVAPGETTEGKMLATILQQGAPEIGPESSTEYISGVVMEAQQEAENALSKQEIPQESREFVRQYFNTIESAKPE